MTRPRPPGGGRCRGVLAFVLAWVAALVLVGTIATTTTGSPRVAYAYDAPDAVRVVVPEIVAAEPGLPQFSGTQEGSASPPTASRRTPTTSFRSVVATNTASPVGEILRQDGVKIVIYSNDHAPPHAHVIGGGTETRIGQNGKPLAGDPELTKKQQKVVDDNINTIRDAIGEYMRWYRENCQ